MPLTEVQIKNCKPREKKYTVQDEGGLYLEIAPTGTRAWRIRYWQNGKEARKTIGRYPTIGLKEARAERDRIKNSLFRGIDPFVVEEDPADITFGKLALDWWEKHKPTLRSVKNVQTTEHRIEAYILPSFKKRHPADINSREIYAVIHALEERGTIETAHRVMDIYKQIFKYIYLLGYIERNPVADLRGLLMKRRPVHHASIKKPSEVGALMRAIEAFEGSTTVKNGLLFSAYTFARPGEVRKAEWTEIDFERKIWEIPGEKMKMGRPHMVPLSEQVIEILEHMKQWTGHGQYIFPNGRSPSAMSPMSENAILAALRRLGYEKGEMTAHGFRSMASTLLNESRKWSRDAIERQLAHVDDDPIRSSYNFAEYWDERVRMMQWWADYLDELREGK